MTGKCSKYFQNLLPRNHNGNEADLYIVPQIGHCETDRSRTAD